MISFIAEGSLFFEKMIRIGNFASGKDFYTTLYQQRDQDFVHALFKEVNNLYVSLSKIPSPLFAVSAKVFDRFDVQLVPTIGHHGRRLQNRSISLV